MNTPTPAAPVPMLSTAAALEILLEAARPLDRTEEVDTFAARGRVLAADITSPIDVPRMATSAMDGYAVRLADLQMRTSAGAIQSTSGAAPSTASTLSGAASADTSADNSTVPAAAEPSGRLTRQLPISQRIPAGHPAQPLAKASVARIFTGATVPPGADAVVMQEQAEVNGDMVSFTVIPARGEWITQQGADIEADSVILPAGRRLDAQSLGLAASVGRPSLPVVCRPKVAVFFTGDELTMPGEPLRPGAIYNSSRYTLRALLEDLGCAVSDFGIVPDTLSATRDTLRAAAADHDLVLTSGGVSVGEEDHVRPAVLAQGRLSLWQIAMKPGKPLAFGELDRPGAPPAFFIGLPGNPVSSFVTFLVFVRPFLLRLAGVHDVTPRVLQLRADFTQAKADRRNEFLRARLNADGGLSLFPNQSSSVLTSTVWADGLIDNPPGHAIQAGEMVRFIPFSELLN